MIDSKKKLDKSFYNSQLYKNKMNYVCYTVQCKLDKIRGNIPKEIKQSHRLCINEILYVCMEKIEQYKDENQFFYHHIENNI